ncbi:MAG: malate dehydrogenase [Armatimonadetes bacterium]|nr:malate dehydrogenase [Armatimonadota bacterium]
MKVTVVGAGHVGATCAQYILQHELADVHLVDIAEGLAAGKALDLAEAMPILGKSLRVTGSQDYAGAADSDLVVITAGRPRKPGMSRDDLLEINGRIVASIAAELRQVTPQALVIVVSNPLDVTAYIVHRVMDLPPERCMGMAGILDTARFRAFVAMELGCSAADVQALVLGGHGDSMVPILSSATVGGIPLTDLLPAERLDAIVQRTRQGGAEIVGLLKTSSAFYAPGAAVAQMVAAIARDEKRLLPASVKPQGEYELEDVFVGLPVILGAAGVEQIVQMSLTDDELQALHRSAEAVRSARDRWHELAGDDPSAWVS